MNIRHLEKRLRKVETTLHCEPDEFADYVCALLWFAVAYYVGNPSRDEKPFAAYARALGYASESELNSSLEDNDLELRKRFVAAEVKLWAKVDWSESSDWKKTLDRIEAGLPKSYKDQIKMVMTQAKISLDWIESHDIAAYIRCFA